MVSIEYGQRIILEELRTLPVEEVPLLGALERILATDLYSPCDLPMADNSAMDGYAFRYGSADGDRLEAAGFLPAGGELPGAVAPGQAVRIMTGALLPEGCDTVVPIEGVEVSGETVRLVSPGRKGSHVRQRGEELKAGDLVIPAGSLLRPQELGMAATLGLDSLQVFGKASVGILATGDELLEPGSQPTPGRIVNSNSIAVAGQVLQAGGEPRLLGIAPDRREATVELIRAGNQADALVITGGVSVGDRDFVKEAIEELGGRILFWKVAMKPGKPVAYALLNGKPVFALPGNPVAAAVAFELFVRPALLKMMGHRRLFRETVRADLAQPAHNRDKRPHLARATVAVSGNGYVVTPGSNQSSASISSLTHCNALLRLPPETDYAAGDVVEVMLLEGRGIETFGAS